MKHFSSVIVWITALVALVLWWGFSFTAPPLSADLHPPSVTADPTAAVDPLGVDREHGSEVERRIPDTGQSEGVSPQPRRLTEANSKPVLEGLDRRIRSARKSLERHFARPMPDNPTNLARAAADHLEAKLFLNLRTSEGYLEAFLKGNYIVLSAEDHVNADSATQVPPLIVGCNTGGSGGSIAIAMDTSAAFAEAVKHVAAKRAPWLDAVAWDFNSKTLEERVRLAARRRGDARWAESNLPLDILIDEARWQATVKPK